jgi:hypothetical protein
MEKYPEAPLAVELSIDAQYLLPEVGRKKDKRRNKPPIIEFCFSSTTSEMQHSVLHQRSMDCWTKVLLLFGLSTLGRAEPSLRESPNNAVLVFNKGEGGYYCHKIPYLFHTKAETLIALGLFLPHPQFS